MKNTHRTSSAFTLIELLTVIAIIGILAAITIPTVGRVRRQAHIAQCQSNLRQIYTALMLYTDDNKGMLPGPLTGAQSPYFNLNAQTANQLAGYLAPYMGVRMPDNPGDDAYNNYLRCPAQYAKMTPAERLDKDAPRSYSIPLANSGNPFGYQSGGETKADSKNFANWQQSLNPRKAWLLRDVDQTVGGAKTTTELPSHETGRNYLYANGSVRFLSPAQETAQEALK